MPTRASQALQKALIYLDKQATERAEELLQDAGRLAESESDNVTAVQAMCVLGELWLSQGRADAALPLLTRVSTTRREDDVLDYEIGRAAELIAEHNSRSRVR